jgi:hypothetical protein
MQFPTTSTLDLRMVRGITILTPCPPSLLTYKCLCRDAFCCVLYLNQDTAVSRISPLLSGCPQLRLQLQRILVLFPRKHFLARKHNAHICVGYCRDRCRPSTDPASHPRIHQIHRPFNRYRLVQPQDRRHDRGRCHCHENKCRFPFPLVGSLAAI